MLLYLRPLYPNLPHLILLAFPYSNTLYYTKTPPLCNHFNISSSYPRTVLSAVMTKAQRGRGRGRGRGAKGVETSRQDRICSAVSHRQHKQYTSLHTSVHILPHCRRSVRHLDIRKKSLAEIFKWNVIFGFLYLF